MRKFFKQEGKDFFTLLEIDKEEYDKNCRTPDKAIIETPDGYTITRGYKVVKYMYCLEGETPYWWGSYNKRGDNNYGRER